MADKIDELLGKSDDELMKLFGIDKELTKAKEGLQAMSKLSGEARTIAAKRVDDMLAPHVYAGEFKYIAESAQREVDRKNKKVTPCSMCEEHGAIPID